MIKSQIAPLSLLLACTCPAVFAADVLWTRQPGLGLHISGSAQSAPWVIGTDEVVTGNYSIHRFNGTNWFRVDGSGRRLAIDKAGEPWLVNAQNRIFRFRLQTGAWELMPGLGVDIAAGGDGSIWLVSTSPDPGGYRIHQWNGSNWTDLGGGALRIAVDRDGVPWVVNNAGIIFRRNPTTRSWEQKGNNARAVYAGLSTGSVWVVENQSIAGGGRIVQWNPANGSWAPYGTQGGVAITESQGTTWMVQSDGGIYTVSTQVSSTGSIIGTGSIVVTDSVMPPMTPAIVPSVSQSGKGGTLLCSVADTGEASYCGDTRADYVGEYSLNLNCSEGFYDPIYGGSCWKCPDDDGDGAWLRGTNSVEKDTACWRIPKESTSSAQKVKSPAWAWECPSGSFWDGYSPDGLGGSCWKCPTTHPRRTANHITNNNACASPVSQESPARLLKFNGCPKPDAASMSLAGKRTPGLPFLDIGAGWSQGVASGGCYACPVVDETGNFLITARNGQPIYDKANNAGCRINFKWQPPQFKEPGLSGLRGVKEVIWENRVFEGDKITAFLYAQAESQGMAPGSTEARIWVAGRWQELAARPYSSETLRFYVFTLLKTALNKDAAVRTVGEKMLIQDFESYIVRRRTFLAEQALAMYEAWKRYSDDARSKRAQSQLEVAFYYGTVPLDFHSMIGSTVAAGGAASGLLGSMVAGQVHRATASGRGIFEMLGKPLNFLKTVQGLAVVSGAAIITAVFAIISDVALDQFMSIDGAPAKLQASIAVAKLPVSLDELSKESDDMLYYFWGKSMDTVDVEDSQVVSVAAAAHQSVKGRGYPRP